MIIDFLQVFIIASLKYVLTLPYALLLGMDYEASVVAILTGGMGGFLFFYYMRKPAIRLFLMARVGACRIVPEKYKGKVNCICDKIATPTKKLVFTKRNRSIVSIKRSYGLWGLVLTTPVLLSIPVGAVLASHFYPGEKKVVGYMLLSIVGWGVVISLIWRLFPAIMQ